MMQYFSYLILFFKAAYGYHIHVPNDRYIWNWPKEVAAMALIAFIVALYGIASLCEGMEILFSAIHAVMSSYPGMLITVAATAYLTYRWYRARYTA